MTFREVSSPTGCPVGTDSNLYGGACPHRQGYFAVIRSDPSGRGGALCTESVAGFDHEGKSWIALALSPHGRVPTGEFADRAVAERARNILQLAQTRDH